MAEPRIIRVRYDGACASCEVAVPARTEAWWDGGKKELRCTTCGPATATGGATTPGWGPLAVPADVAAARPGRTSAKPLRPNIAGASAQRIADRRHSGRETKIRARYPRLGGLILALSEDPQSTTAWAQGAEGERRVGARLDSLGEAGVMALHDRKIPGSKANIDHIAITANNIWVIDAKRYTGQVAKKDVGGLFRTDIRLMVGRRDCTKLVVAMARQVEAVRLAMGGKWTGVPIKPALCFVGADWGWFASPFELQGVLVSWPKALADRLTRPGPLTSEAVNEIHSTLAMNLRPA